MTLFVFIYKYIRPSENQKVAGKLKFWRASGCSHFERGPKGRYYFCRSVRAEAHRAEVAGDGVQGWKKFWFLNISRRNFRPLFNAFVVIKTIQSSLYKRQEKGWNRKTSIMYLYMPRQKEPRLQGMGIQGKGCPLSLGRKFLIFKPC